MAFKAAGSTFAVVRNKKGRRRSRRLKMETTRPDNAWGLFARPSAK